MGNSTGSSSLLAYHVGTAFETFDQRGISEALQVLAKEYAWAVDLDICVFPQEGLTTSPDRSDPLQAIKKCWGLCRIDDPTRGRSTGRDASRSVVTPCYAVIFSKRPASP